MRELDLRRNYKVNVIAVVKDYPRKIQINQDPDDPFEASDTIAIIGKNEDIDKVSE